MFSTVQYCPVLYSTVQYCTVLYNTPGPWVLGPRVPGPRVPGLRVPVWINGPQVVKLFSLKINASRGSSRIPVSLTSTSTNLPLCSNELKAPCFRSSRLDSSARCCLKIHALKLRKPGHDEQVLGWWSFLVDSVFQGSQGDSVRSKRIYFRLSYCSLIWAMCAHITSWREWIRFLYGNHWVKMILRPNYLHVKRYI